MQRSKWKVKKKRQQNAGCFTDMSVYEVVIMVVALASLIVTLMPSKRNNKILNSLTLNIFKASNVCEKSCGPSWRGGSCDPDCPCAPQPHDHPWNRLMHPMNIEDITPKRPLPNRRAAIAHTRALEINVEDISS